MRDNPARLSVGIRRDDHATAKPNSFRPDPHDRDRQGTALTRPAPTTICRIGTVRPQRMQEARTRINQPLGHRGMDYRLALSEGTVLGDIKAS
jgi:hypothetical protein